MTNHNVNRVIGGYRSRRTRLVNAMRNASPSVKREMKKRVAEFDRVIEMMARFEYAAAGGKHDVSSW